MPRNWQFSSHDAGLVQQLSHRVRCSSLLAQVLLARGLETAEQAQSFLAARLQDLQEPEELPGIESAVAIILQAIADQRKITIYGDYDVDGMTATSILLLCFRAIGAEADYYIPCRLEEGYGLNCDALQELYDSDPQRLVITVDCGIASLKEAEFAKQLGLQLIITDHHQLGQLLPAAAVVVHPRRDRQTNAFPEFCGAGVAFQLAWAICKKLGDGRRASVSMREFLKSAVCLAMIGTIADVVPLVGQNRLLVKYGLDSFQQQAGVGLQALTKVAGVDKKNRLTSEDIGFGLAPRLNAAGRLGQARLAVDLLTTTDPARASQLAEYLDGLNKQRQTVERKILKQAKEQIADHPEWQTQPFLVLAHHDWHPGVIGIVASRVAELFEKPTILISLGTNHGYGQGSGRTFGGINLHQAVHAASEHLIQSGGHPAAIGLKIQPDQIDSFRQAINAATLTLEQSPEPAPRMIDSEVSFQELTVQSVKELELLGPFGNQNERPLFVSTGVELTEPPKTMGEGGRHLSLRVKQYGQTYRAVAFGRADWAEQIEQVQGRLAVCFKPNINEFRGQMNVELLLVDWRSDQQLTTDLSLPLPQNSAAG